MSFIKPGILEVYTGPMKSGKTKALFDRVDQLRYLKEKNSQNRIVTRQNFLFIKPANDTRDGDIKSRAYTTPLPCGKIQQDNPYGIIAYIRQKEQEEGKEYHLIAIDEAQFFAPGIEHVIELLQRERRNIAIAGLDLDFRGASFGSMGVLALMANEVYKFTSVCDYHDCESPATRTQRLINGKPAPYDAPIISIEGANAKETYEARCLAHHFVPGKPEPARKC